MFPKGAAVTLASSPGSHLKDEVEYPADGVSNPPDALEVRVPAGTAVIFDRRIWHAGGWNFSDITRKVLFVGYSLRWFHPRDEMTVSRYMDRCDPIRRQLLGSKTGNLGSNDTEGRRCSAA